MPRSHHPLQFRRRRAWLLTLGLLAMALHLLAGSGLVRAASPAGGGDGFVAELCTSHGVIQLDASRNSSDGSRPASVTHDCCKLCAAGGPLLNADSTAGVAPAPTFTTPGASYLHVRPALVARTAHPPRGPPARA